MTNVLALLKYVPLIPAALKVESDVEADIKDPSEANLNLTVQDAEALVEKIFPNVPKDKLDAACGILLTAITLKSQHDIANIESDLVVIGGYLSTLLGVNVTVGQSN